MYRQLLLMTALATLVGCGDLTVLFYTVDADPNVSSIDAIRVTINGVDQEPFTINSDEFAVNGGDGVTFTITPGSRSRDVEVEVSGLSGGIVRAFDGEVVTVESGRTLDRELRLIPSDFAITNSPGSEMQLSTNVGRGGGQLAVVGDELLVAYVGSELDCQMSNSCLAIGQVLDFQGQPVATSLVGQDDPASPFILNGAGGPPPDPAVAGSDSAAAMVFRTAQESSSAPSTRAPGAFRARAPRSTTAGLTTKIQPSQLLAVATSWSRGVSCPTSPASGKS